MADAEASLSGDVVAAAALVFAAILWAAHSPRDRAEAIRTAVDAYRAMKKEAKS